MALMRISFDSARGRPFLAPGYAQLFDSLGFTTGGGGAPAIGCEACQSRSARMRRAGREAKREGKPDGARIRAGKASFEP
jgi:hypothetical protein